MKKTCNIPFNGGRSNDHRCDNHLSATTDEHCLHGFHHSRLLSLPAERFRHHPRHSRHLLHSLLPHQHRLYHRHGQSYRQRYVDFLCKLKIRLLCNLVIFCPHKWGRNIMICVAFFLQILPNLLPVSLHLTSNTRVT